MKLYEQLLKILVQLEVKQIFGVPGDAINPLVEAIRKQDEIEFVHVTHEESGAFAASAQAKLTGKLAVCAGTVGPGAIHLLNGLYDAKKDHVPVLAITGQVPQVEMGFQYHQEVNLATLFADVSVFQDTIDVVDQMPRIAVEACNAAIYHRGVSVMTIPHDIGSMSVKQTKVEIPTADYYNLSSNESQFDKVVKMIDEAETVSILYGEGCRDSAEELLQLATHLSAPMVFSLKAKDIVAYDNKYVAGGIGLLGSTAGVKAMESCDLLLTLGSDFPYRDWYPQNTAVVHVDLDPTAIGRRITNEVGLIGDCKNVIPILKNRLEKKSNETHLKAVIDKKESWNKGLEKMAAIDRSRDLIHPQAVAKIIGELADEDTIFCCDTGAVTVWGARDLLTRGSQRFSCSFNLASMAYALPAAIGAQFSFPKRQVISLSGDGGFNMLMGDFLTVVKYKLPITVIIFNNHKLGLIKMEQEVEGYPEYETDLHNPDYAMLAKSFGAAGETVKDPSKLRAALIKALTAQVPYILDVHINPNELTLPPKIEIAQAWGFGKAKVKEFLETIG